MANFNASQFNAQVRAAQRRAEQQLKREIDRMNRANQKAVDDYNRQVEAHNRKADAHNKRVINKQLRQGGTTVRYTEPERRLADRVHEAVSYLDPATTTPSWLRTARWRRGRERTARRARAP